MKQKPDEIRSVKTILGTVEFKHYREYRIGDIILKDIWISSKGVIQRDHPLRKDKRAYRILHWRSCRNRSLRRLMFIAWFLRKYDLKLYQIGSKVMIDIIMQMYKCSRRTAIDYVTSLQFIAEQFGIYD